MTSLSNIHFVSGAEENRVTMSRSHWEIDPNSIDPTWVEKAPLPAGSTHCNSAVVGDKWFFLGGTIGHESIIEFGGMCNPNMTAKDFCFIYDDVDEWTTMKPIPVPVSHLTAVPIPDEKLIVLLGGVY